MPADNLYGEGAQLLSGATQASSEMARTKAEGDRTTAEAGSQAAGRLSEQRLQSQRAHAAIQQIDEQAIMNGHMMKITPNVALGLAKETKDPEWLKAIGQTMPTGFVLGNMKLSMEKEMKARAPKISQYNDNGKIRHTVVYQDEDGNIQQLLLDPGMTPEQLNKGKGGGRGGKNAEETMNFRQKQQFIRSYESRKKQYDKDTEFATDTGKFADDKQWLDDNRDTYDGVVKTMAKGGSGGAGGPAPKPSGGSADNKDAGGTPNLDSIFEGL